MAVAVMLLPLLFCMLSAAGQDKKLKEVRIKHKKNQGPEDIRIRDFAPGMKVITIDSALLQQYSMQQVSLLLSQQVPVFVKSYGVNSMATLSFRGSSAAQSQVYWNGIPLNNASLGMTDVSLLNVNSFDKINIAYGSSSALLGSGNVGGALLLEQAAPLFDSPAHHRGHIAMEAGSYGQYRLALRHTFSNRRWFADTRIGGQSARNDFSYTDVSGQKQSMPNASLLGLNILSRIAYRMNPRNTLGLSAWYQAFDREIPPALFEQSSEKQQKDASLRLAFDWQQQPFHGSNWYAKIAFVADRMRYDDPAVSLSSANNTYQSYAEAGWRKVFNAHHQLLLFAPFSLSWMKPQQDSEVRSQQKAAIAAAYKYETLQGRIQASLNLRAEQINTQQVLLPGINMSYRCLPLLTLRANVQRSYRAPTLNEWYYTPGGNPQLRPEQGWNQDAGYRLEWPITATLRLDHDASVFNRNISDWILWFGGSIWTPHNIAKVHSRGIETINSLLWQKGNWQVHAGLNTSFVMATTVSSYLPNDGSIGKQIPYAPRYNGQGNIGFGYRNFYLNYNHTYTGYRFTTTDESQFITPYQTGNLYLCYQLRMRRQPLKCSFLLNNIWGASYQVVNLRPMPRRNFSLGISKGF